ncbi:rab11 interacting protein [Arctopsyche grandis]|uniref:rab11 interacting protein n=1 Tax=Arctopsyche grandis TaxID=121162 RepID=UPI00406D90E7
MWSPTHVQVTVQRAKRLLVKGKNNTNDCFVTIGLGKDKFQTSVKEKSTDNADWREECDLIIPAQGNKAEVILIVLHRNFVADQFLGQISIPLSSFDVYETPRNKWYKLENKPGKDNAKDRGEIEVKIGFTVKEGSLNDLSKKEKHKSSMGQLSHVAQSVGGSLMSIGSLEKRKGIKKFAKNLGSKMHLNRKEKKENTSPSGSINSLNTSKSMTNSPFRSHSKQTIGEADPGVISEDEDEFAFDDLSHKSSGSSLNVNNNSTLPRTNKYVPSPMNASLENLGGGELLRRSTSSGIIAPEKTPPPKPVRLGLDDLTQAPKVTNIQQTDEWSQKLYNKGKVQSQNFLDKEKSMTQNKSIENLSNNLSKEKSESPKYFKKFGSREKAKKALGERIIIGEEGIIDEVKMNPAYSKLPNSVIKQFETKTKEELVVQVYSLQNEIDSQKKKVKDLENYLDQLLLRVMETTPRILQNPYSTKNSCKI